MRGVEKQPENFRIGGAHQSIYIGFSLHAGAGMVVIDNPHPVIVGNVPDFVQAGGKPVPLRIVEFWLVGEGGDWLQMGRMSDFGGVDVADTERPIERDRLPERL